MLVCQLCALCPDLNEDMVLTVALVKQLRFVLTGSVTSCDYDVTADCNVTRSDQDSNVLSCSEQAASDDNADSSDESSADCDTRKSTARQFRAARRSLVEAVLGNGGAR